MPQLWCINLLAAQSNRKMTINYARLCAQYVSACALIRQGLAISDFNGDAYNDPDRQNLAAKIKLIPYDAPNPNDLVPIQLTLEMEDGTEHKHELSDVYGAPAKPMSKSDYLKKFRNDCQLSARPISGTRTERLIQLAESLERQSDLNAVVECLVP